MSIVAISVPRLNVFFTKVCLLEECFSVSFWNDVEQFGETAGGVRNFRIGFLFWDGGTVMTMIF
jgi:hypothetical protein